MCLPLTRACSDTSRFVLTCFSLSLAQSVLSLPPTTSQGCARARLCVQMCVRVYLLCVSCVCACHGRKFGKRCVREISRLLTGAFKMAVISSAPRSCRSLAERGAAPYLDGLLSGFTRGFHESLSHFTSAPYVYPFPSVIRDLLAIHTIHTSPLEESFASVQPTLTKNSSCSSLRFLS